MTSGAAAQDCGPSAPVDAAAHGGTGEPVGAALLQAVAVMDRLRSPGGCPWDAEQTHASLVRYAIEEAHEVAEAVEAGDRGQLRDELGDLLLQVLFHARIAMEEPDGFDIDDVARALVAKLTYRHPHVFTDDGERDLSAAQVTDQWEQLKSAERVRASALEGIPVAMPALARASKMLGRIESAGIDVDLTDLTLTKSGSEQGLGQIDEDSADGDPVTGGPVAAQPADGGTAELEQAAGGLAEADPAEEIGRQLLALSARARAAGVDAEAALRTQLRHLQDAVHRAEGSAAESAAAAGATAEGPIAERARALRQDTK